MLNMIAQYQRYHPQEVAYQNVPEEAIHNKISA